MTRATRLTLTRDTKTERTPPSDDEALVEGLVAAIAREPSVYSNLSALKAAAGVDDGELDELFQTYYHTIPAEMLARLRIAAARRMLQGSQQPVEEIAFEVGFETLSTFDETFRAYTAMTPAQYCRLPESATFELALPDDYPLGRILGYLGRDRNSLTERVEGQTCLIAYRVDEQPALVRITFADGSARCEVVVPVEPDAGLMAGIHRRVLATLGLTVDPARFEAHVSAARDLAPLIAGQRGLRVPLLADPFDGLVWAIIGQQINLAFAYTLRRRLIERVSQPIGEGLYAPPAVAGVAALEPEELLPLSFSRAKAGYLIGAARSVVDGRLPLDALAGGSATRIERSLLAVRGIGPWSAHYLMMRHYGFLDCVPLGDTGLTSGLKQFFALDERPGRVETLALMERFRPYRSLATFHLWQRHGAVA